MAPGHFYPVQECSTRVLGGHCPRPIRPSMESSLRITSGGEIEFNQVETGGPGLTGIPDIGKRQC
jgi:hypothetical protein